MVLKFKKIYVDEKFKEDISNNIISYDLILDIFFSKKNYKIFRYGLFCYYILWFFQVLLPIIFSILISTLYFFYKNLYPYLPIAFLSFYVITTLTFIAYFIYIGLFKKRYKKNKYFLSFINIYFFYIDLRTHIDDKRQKKDFSKMRLAKKVLTESKTLKPTWTFESSPLIAIKILYLKSLPNNDSRYNSGEILLCTDYIYRTLHSIEETSNLIYINENVIDNKKKEKWFKEKYFWKIILYYNTILVTLFWFFLSPFILFIFSINAI